MSATKIAISASVAAFMLLTLLVATTAGTLASLLPTTTTDPTSPQGGTTTNPSAAAISDIPADYLALYQKAATLCPPLGWHVLAAIGKIESDHGRSRLPGVSSAENAAGAGGQMQVLQSTWNAILARHRIPPGGATPPSRYNPHDAIHAAAYLLCDSGANRGDLRTALYAYNHADWYVTKVLDQANRYRQAIPPPEIGAPEPASNAATANAVVAFARAQIGQPYLWGGDGPAEGGFDCSGLSKAAYAAAGMTIPRTAHTQYLAGPRLPGGTAAQPGDLIFFGTPAKVHHVAIATGRGSEIIHAPDRGQTVRLGDWRKFPDLLAISRPSAQPTNRN